MPDYSTLDQPDPGSDILSGAGGSDPFMPRPDLINAIIQAESGGRANAVSNKGAVGLMQIMPATAARYRASPNQLYNADFNKRLGTQYFSDLLRKYHGNEFLALVAYNSGPGRVDQGQLLPQSVRYASDILGRAPKTGSNPLQQSGANLWQQIMRQAMSGQQAGPAQLSAKQQGGFGGATGGPPSTWSRILASLQPGVAEAAEGPPGATPAAAGGGSTGAASPGAAATPNPFNTGAWRSLIQAQQAVQGGAGGAPPPGGGGAPGAFNFSDFSNAGFGSGMPFRRTMRMGPTGPTMEFTEQPIPQRLEEQASAAHQLLDQTNQAKAQYQRYIAPYLSRYGFDAQGRPNSLVTDPLGVIHRALQYPESRHSQIASYFGAQADKGVSDFYDMLGPITATQLRQLVGGRVGESLLRGRLADHLPDPSTDSLPRLYQKLQNMQKSVIPVLNEVYNMRAMGVSEDRINDWASQPAQ